MLLYLATLQNVPRSLYESSRNRWSRRLGKVQKYYFAINHSYYFYDVITSTIGSFQIFQEAVMTKNGTGGPAKFLLL